MSSARYGESVGWLHDVGSHAEEICRQHRHRGLGRGLQLWAVDTLAEVGDGNIESVASTWVNQLGLSQTDPTVWRDRLTEACTEGVWDPEVASELVTEDREASVGGDAADLPATGAAADALWIMAVQVCRDSSQPAPSTPGRHRSCAPTPKRDVNRVEWPCQSTNEIPSTFGGSIGVRCPRWKR